MSVEALFQISEPGESAPKAACAGRVVGIDLGTTNSLVATVRGGQPLCLGGDEAMVPSVVFYGADGGVVVGREALTTLGPQFPSDTLASVKRFMGRGPKDADATRKLTPYRFANLSPGDSVVRFEVAGGKRAVTPVEVSAEILKVLRARAEGELGGELDGVVITVPAYFDDAQRQATRDAGRLAGLEVLRLLNEPTAAALAYGLDKQVEGTFAVFDLGGGTFDVSILNLADGVFEVKSTGGDSALGGDDFDRVVAGHLLQKMGVAADAAGDRLLSRRVLDAARAAKEALTDADQVDVQVARTEGGVFSDHLDRGTLEALVRPVLDRCAAPVRRALKDAALAPGDLQGVILVGGATRMPIVRRFVKDLFGRDPLSDIDPDQVVALGAAIQADVLGGVGRDDVVLLDVVPLSLGLEMMGGVAEKIIHRNTTVPCGATQTFTTYADNQTGFDLHVLQGERELVADCRSLGRFSLQGIPPLPAGMARLEVTFVVDADGILNVSARELVTGNEANIKVKPSYGLSDDEVERMLLDSFSHAETDVKERLLRDQRVEAERILAATQAAVLATPELLQPGEKEAIAAAAERLRGLNAGIDHRAIKAGIEALDLSSKDFAQRRMNRALGAGLAGKNVDVALAEVDSHTVKGAHGTPGHTHG